MAAVTSRRNLLASALVAAAAIPTLRPAHAKQPDAELLAYGRELDGCILDYEVACAKYRPLWDKLEARVAEECRPDGERFEDFYRRLTDEVGLSAMEQKHEHPDGPMDRSDAPSRAIMAIPATTLAGLAVKARLAKFGASQIWEASYENTDWDHLVLRNLVDAVLALAAGNPDMTRGAA